MKQNTYVIVGVAIIGVPLAFYFAMVLWRAYTRTMFTKDDGLDS